MPFERSRGVSVRIPAFAAAVSLAAILAGCAPAAPSAPPAPGVTATVATPTGSPLAGEVFESDRYGYRIALPDGWTATETPGTGGLHPNEPGVDTLDDRAGHLVSIVGEPAPELAAWTCAIRGHLEGEHALPVETTEAIVVGGEEARLVGHHLLIDPYVIHYLTAEVVHEGRGLTVSLESTTGDDAADRAILDDLLSSLEWTG